jgi:ATP-dependent 26S proteasome regulatory subunit
MTDPPVPAAPAAPAAAFASSVEQLLAELERVDLLIRSRVAQLRRAHGEDADFRGLYISEQEVDALLARPLGTPQWLDAAAPGRWADIDAALAALDASLRARAAATAASGSGVALRLDRLATLFALERFDIDVLLVGLAGELDVRYERLYAYLQDDVTRKRPTVDLALNLLTASPAAHLAARRRFLPDAPLLRHGLVELVEDAAPSPQPLLSKGFQVDARIVDHLLGSDAVDARLAPFAALLDPGRGLDELLLEDDWRRAVANLHPEETGAAAAVIHLSGPPGVGRRSVAAALCHDRGLGLLVAQVDRLLAEPVTALADRLALLEREARLQRAVVCFHGVDPLRDGSRQEALAIFRAALDHGVTGCFLTGDAPWDDAAPLCARRCVHLEVPRPSAPERRRMWRRAMAAVPVGSTIDTAAVAGRFRLTFGQIEDAVATARGLARLRGEEPARVTDADLFEACRLNSNRRLGALARKITPRYRWDDIVLPEDRLAQLRELCNHVKYRDRVYGEWGFGARLALGKGLMVLLAGPSGTGKTMAADVVAGELGLELYRIDLSSVVSKYIGETEKNLGRIFDEAETSNAILFFDEADALFGKRSEVKDAHDRYANIEVGYLLQRMEAYEGIAILATNLRKNMDEAFVRRLHFTLELPFPDAEGRRRIWEGIWPADTPREDGLDLAALARRFELTGGNIRNVALAAAFLAADDPEAGGVVRMRHLVHATRREFQKTGKLMRDDDFTEQERP